MIDCHCHILPGLDDGAADLEESLYLCRWFVRHGYTEVVCTSHRTRLYPNSAETVEQAVADLQQELDRRNIELHLTPSLEYRLIPETWRPERLLPWLGNHLLVELPLKNPVKMGKIVPENEIRQLIADGFQPVLAHPERYLWASPADYECWHDAGALFQRNMGSLEGFYGSPARERTKYLLEKGWYTYLFTDLHNRRYADFFDGILK